MITLSRVGIAIFGIAVVLGPIYTVSDYSVVRNLISELAAQHTQNNFVMIIAFILLGSGIIIDGIRTFKLSFLPFILFGVTMVFVGLFPHKPIDTALTYNSTLHNIHGILASVAGIFITVGFVWQGLLSHGRPRLVCFYLVMVAIVFPILMLKFPNFQGVVQRLMYLQILGWIWMKYPKSLVTS